VENCATSRPDTVGGRTLTVDSASPRSYADIVSRAAAPAVRLDARLVMPASPSPCSAVIIVPGSGGLNPAMQVHARRLADSGIAALLLDPFGGRAVRDTIADQGQFSFAASTWDVFAAMHRLQQEPGIDPERLGAMGYSRGGLAVIQAAMSVLADPALGGLPRLRAVLAGWPWCGYQFAAPAIGNTALRMLVADCDDWASPVQAQAYFSALRAHSDRTSLRLFRNAQHGFGYDTTARSFPDAIAATAAPIAYFDECGVFLDPWTGQAQPDADDATIRELLEPFITRGVHVGTRDGQMAEFMTDFTGFFQRHLLRA
jgi:dienelactone hydrolase